MPHVNQLVDQYEKKGFVVVGVTNVGGKEPEEKTRAFIEETGLRAIVALEPGLGSMGVYGFKGFPSAALVGPKGKIVWTGHPAGLEGSVIEQNLKGVRVGRPKGDLAVEVDLPDRCSGAARKLQSGNLGYAWQDLAKAAGDSRLSGQEAASIQAAIGELEFVVENETKRAEEAVAEKRYYDAKAAWLRLSKAFRGHEAGRTAAEHLAELIRDPALKKEVTAGERIDKALDLVDEGKVDAAIRTLRTVTVGPLAETEEARRAETIAAKLEAGG